MEEVLHQAEAVLGALEESLEEFEAFLPTWASLVAYYESDDWMRHYEMDEAGQLSQELARGVLSQDAVYNLILAYRDLKQSMKELGEREDI